MVQRMADLEHLEMLGRGVDVWNSWRAEHPEITPQLANAQLFAAQLSRADLRMADFYQVNLESAHLESAVLRGANLSHAQLPYADLVHSDLSGVDADNANFFGADMREVDLRSASLYMANLARAKLDGARLQQSVLIWANLCGAYLFGAHLEGASILGTNFGDVDLSGVEGLHDVRHFGSSTVGTDTIFSSKGQISDIFLRNAGVPDNFINYAVSLVSQPIQFYSCFISYSHSDMAFARRLHETLQRKGIRCWLDEKQLLPGDDIYEQVDRGIKLWDKVLLCCSQHSLTSWWVDNEIDAAFEKERLLMKERGKKVLALIPLDLDGYLLDGKWNSGKARQVLSRLAADFTGWRSDNRRFESQMERLLQALYLGSLAREGPPDQRL
jgi:uncharacterized protein YjbI with pentapeptide repeats